jgi:cephalosporin-C deacetylase-like acetyl esterase
MHVGRLVAIELGRRGMHAFLVQLPGYGQRKSVDFKQDDLVSVFTQGICDVRRARDAVAALPQVDAAHIGLQGTSLGGFVATLSASLDGRFDSVFLLLCGGDLHGVLTSGAKDAQKALDRLIASGVAADQVATTLRRVEPLRIAHRLEPERTWLFSATLDDVVLPKFSERLAEAAQLTGKHHQRMLATHYSGVVFLPGVLQQIGQTVLKDPK